MKRRKVFIIAEAGVNHNGSLKIARKMVDIAFKSGADAIKFQTFKAKNLVSRYAPKADYQKKETPGGESQLEMLEKLEFGIPEHRELITYCRKKGIKFFSTPFDLESIDLLNSLGLKTLKIPSGEITNLPYLRKIGSLKKKLVISTGMADMREVSRALNILTKAGTPKKNITALQCNTEYPTPYKDVNLLGMLAIRNALGVRVGYSDHTPGIEVAVAAAALGASVIEKHFTLDKKMKGPDHKASIEPDELKAMVRAIRNIELALGSEEKKVSASEMKNKEIVRKSIVALKEIKKGELFSYRNITVKRPGSGISPMHWERVIGKRAKRDFGKDQLIRI